MNMLGQCPSLPTCISNSVILLCRPRSCCCRAVFSPFREVICCWMRLFSAFWKLKCLFLNDPNRTFPPRCGPANCWDSSWRRQSSWWALTPRCLSHFWGSELPSCDYSAHCWCSWFVAALGKKYLECLQLALEGCGVGAEAVSCLVHANIIKRNGSYLFILAEQIFQGFYIIKRQKRHHWVRDGM